jgi:stage III sporulation protein SpoIIIAA
MDNHETNRPKEQHESKEIEDVMRKLSSSSLVAVSTDKKNSYVTMETKHYIFEVRQHLAVNTIKLK